MLWLNFGFFGLSKKLSMNQSRILLQRTLVFLLLRQIAHVTAKHAPVVTQDNFLYAQFNIKLTAVFTSCRNLEKIRWIVLQQM